MRTSRLARFAVAVAAVLALLAGNSLVALPAAAAPQSLFLFVTDGGVAQVGFDLTAVRTSDNAAFTETTDASGVAIFSLDPGTYDVTTQDDGVYRVQSRSFTVNAGSTTHSGMALTRRGVVTGSIPADAVGHTTVSAFTVSNGTTPMPGTVTWVGNSFRYVFNDSGTNALDYYVTLLFDVDDTVPYRDTYLGGHAGPPQYWSSPGPQYLHVDSGLDVGPVSLIGASFVSGSVSGPYGAIEGATVRASANGFATTFTATTDAAGDFQIVLSAGDATYAVNAEAPGYVTAGTAVTVNAGNNWRATTGSIDLDTTTAIAYGDVVDQAGHSYQVETYLYAQNASTGRFEDAGVEIGTTSSFESDALAPGRYRLALFDTASSSFIPWTDYQVRSMVGTDTVGGPDSFSAERPGGDCYIEFEIVDNVGDTVFDHVRVDPSAGNGLCAGGLGGTLSGSVYNHHSSMGDLTAELATIADPHSVIDAVPVRADGSYVLQGVTADADYFVTIRTEDDVEWFDTFLGDVIAASLDDLSGVTAISLTAGSSVSGTHVTLVPATVFTGTVTSGGTPLANQCVIAIDEADSTTWCDSTDPDGVFHIKAPVGRSYTLEASGWGYESRAYADPSDPDETMVWSSTPRTTFSGLDFDLTPWSPSIYGTVFSDVGFSDPVDDVTVHLYARIGSGWGEVASHSPAASFSDGYYEFHADDVFPDDGVLPAGDYRLRFEAADGSWLPVSQYSDLGVTYTLSTDSCFVDVTSLVAGPPREISVALNSASAVSCGDEPAAADGDVTGILVESDARGNAPIEGQPVELRDDDGDTVATATTNALGEYTFADVPSGRYTIAVPTRAHVAGEHSYVEESFDDILVAGGAAVPALELVRYGNITGTINGWVPTSAPTRVVALRYDSSDGEWHESSGIEVEIAADGTFEAPGIDIDEYYTLYFDGPDDSPYLDAFYRGTPSDALGSDFQGSAEQDYALGAFDLETAEYITGTVTTATGTPIAGATVTALSLVFYDVYTAVSAADGTYSIKVQGDSSVIPFNVYEVSAEAAGYIDQWYLNDNGGCGCNIVPVIVGTMSPMPWSDIDFALFPTGTIIFDTYDGYFDDAATTYEEYEGVTTHVYKKVTGGWQEVTSVTSDVYGHAVAGASGAGDYRVRFSEGSRWLKVDEFARDGGSFAAPDGDRCFVDLAGLQMSDHVELEFELDEQTAAGVCAGEPAIIPATTPTKGSKPFIARVLAGTTVAPTPSASPSASPSAAPSPEPEPSASATAEPEIDQEETAAQPDLGWVWVLIAIVLALLLAGGAVVILRRR